MTIKKPLKKPQYRLKSDGEFVISNYNFSRPFADFFPGIAGKYGIPMWTFYVNRGQGIASFGTKDKDHSILEFFPADKAWQLVSLRGFRTFIKLANGKDIAYYEPFHNGLANFGFKITNSMHITSYDLRIKENNLSLGLETEVEYFTVPNDSYAALVRIVTIKNTSRSNKKIQLLDGLPQIIPFGTGNLFLKKLSRTIEAWMTVKNLENCVPFYKLDVDPTDRPEVVHIKEGNFYLGFHYRKNKPCIIKPIIDPTAVFGPVTDLSCPYNFLHEKNFNYPEGQISRNKTPSGMLLLDMELQKGEAKTFFALAGYMRSQEILNASLKRITAPGYLQQKRKENREIILGLQQDIATESSSPEFDLYAKQTYLDNIMRGGYPVLFKSARNTSVFYLYARKHGDLERDYNKFQLEPSYFSQGNGNYRDINQNRRSDIWFNPEIGEHNVITFFNLLQADGFNPLVVKGMRFALKASVDLKNTLAGMVEEKYLARLELFVTKPFTPGSFLFFLEEAGIKLKTTPEKLLNTVIECSLEQQDAEHGEGFWTDHWTYNLDLLKNYLGVYPEKLKELVFEKKAFTFFDNTEVVRPREEKYILRDKAVRQLHSVIPDNTKRELIKKRNAPHNIVRTQNGLGEIYQTTMINKLLCLAANKLASLDPSGIGIEMEANKPNWFDALNGLPALFGSSLCETLELKRLLLFIRSALEKTALAKVYVSAETYQFLVDLGRLVQDYLGSDNANRDYIYWDKSSALKEQYRHQTKLGFSGKENELDCAYLASILDNAIRKLDIGIAKARDEKKDIYCAYFMHEVAEHQPLKAPAVKPTRFIQKRLPLFLEAQMHALRLTQDTKKARSLYRALKDSALYDKKLKMYKVTAALADMPEEIGRCRVFTPGWLENESIWLHMEYKYLLEVLSAGLCEEFYDDFRKALIPFQDPARYGRNILENSSFLVGSAFPDKELHGNGFVARLSGSTAEFLQIWRTINVGKRPFRLDAGGRLSLKFEPLLAGWLFTKDSKTYSFNFLGKIRVTYHNPARKNTFGSNNAVIKKILLTDANGKKSEINSDTVPSPYAQQIRSRQIQRIDISLE